MNDTKTNPTAFLPDVVRSCLVEFPGESPERVLAQINRDVRHPNSRGDWRGKLPSGIVEAWHDLSVESKVVAYLMARWVGQFED